MIRHRLLSCLGALVLLALAGCAGPSIAAPATHEPLGVEDGYVGFGETIGLDDDLPAITNLDPALRAALDAAAAAAAERDVVFTFTDAWRSERYQQELFDDAVLKYGSKEEALRWVKPATESAHVSGRAVDIATADAMDWLTRFGAEFGLCQIYANEPWHYEHIEGVTQECPPQQLDSSGLGAGGAASVG
jgi:hypothetical protein